jgi:CMP-N-acetylneuraminate monooxygenase
MDPWLRGPCFLGAWIHYPPSSVDFGDLHPNAIWITHEHSDHFHPGTLEAFNRSTPMFVPDFPDGRLPSRLASMGFSNIRRVPFGEPIALAPECRLTAFEPGSIWNDSIVLLEVAGFRILNLSDAGVNQRIADLVGSVDMITTAYSAASSSYPFTWNHLTRQQKQEIFKRATRGALQMVVGAVRLYRAKYVLPFADHFTLWHPSHREYVEMMPPLTAADVADALEPCDGVKVIDLLPGESFDVVRGHRMTLWQDRSRVYEREYLLRYIAQRWDEAEFNQSFPVGRSTTESEVEDYFMTLNRTPEIAFCEDLTVTIRATNVDRTEVKLEIAFRVSGGRIARVSVPESSHELLIELPMEVLASIVREDLSWDEASIGFWCRFHRSPDVYHVGFWRLLHAPYYHRPADVPPVERRHVTRYTAIADVIERFGPDMDRVMRRGGLYCLACSHAPGETIEQGARKHGLDEHAIERLLTEMNSVACGAADPIREASSDFN